MFSSETINKIFLNISKEFPNPATELKYINEYTLLVAVVLSAQSTDLSVNKATQNLFTIIDSPAKMLALGEEKLKEYIKSIGLYNSKAKNIISLSTTLIENYNSELPKNFEDLIQLPGVGRKTANVVLNCLFQKPTLAVDTHVFRVSNRIGLVNESSIIKTEKKLLEIIPQEWLLKAHNLLVLHGRYICKSKKPNCLDCSVKLYCRYFSQTQTPHPESGYQN